MSDADKQKKALSVLFLQDMHADFPVRPELVSTSHGKIEQVLMAIPAAVSEGGDDSLWNVYRELFLKLPAYTRFIVVTHPAIVGKLQQWFTEHNLEPRVTLRMIPDYITFTIWVQDPFIAVKDTATGKTFLIEPHSFPRWEDGYIADFVAKQTDFINLPAPLYFEGGNILIGDDFYLIGADYPVKSMSALNQVIMDGNTRKSPCDRVRELYSDYLDKSRKLLFVGSTIPVPHQKKGPVTIGGEEWQEIFYTKNEKGTVQPMFHLDMFITLAGRGENGAYRLLIGDPGLAAEILNEPVSAYAMPEVFDNIADKLNAQGFEVYRNPMPLIYVDDREKKRRKWYFASGNNGLMEIINGKERRYWLPTYGYGNWKNLKATDEENMKIWESLNFRVTVLDDYHPLAEHTGAAHCIINYLQRGENEFIYNTAQKAGSDVP